MGKPSYAKCEISQWGEKMNCKQCSKELYEHNFLSLRKYEKIEDEDYLIGSHDFCSKECADKFKEKQKNQDDLELFEIRRCVGYHDCERLDNLRGICETKERVNSGGGGIFGLSLPPLNRMCEPAQVGIIKASLGLLDVLDSFGELSLKHNKQMLKQEKSNSELLKSMDDVNKISSKLNKKMLNQTEKMNMLTKLILIITGVNLGFLIIQIILVLITNNMV